MHVHVCAASYLWPHFGPWRCRFVDTEANVESATDELPAAMAVVSADVGDDVDDIDADAEEDSPPPTRPPPRWRLCRPECGDG